MMQATTTMTRADFRKSDRGLAAIVEQALGYNPFDGGLYAFTNRQRNKIKLLMWEDNGFVLYYKVLAEEKFRRPRPEDGVMRLTGEQINWLLGGYDISLMKDHRKLHYPRAADARLPGLLNSAPLELCAELSLSSTQEHSFLPKLVEQRLHIDEHLHELHMASSS